MAAAVDRAYASIRDRILAGTLPAGSHLTAADLADELNVSRTPIREALRLLHAEGLVRIIANQGAYVNGWTRKDMEDLYNIRTRLETYACELAAKNMPVKTIDELAELDRRMRILVDTTPADYRGEIKRLNYEFHRRIIDCALNPRLADSMSAFVEGQLIMLTFQSYSAADLQRSMAHHSELVDAFRARDAGWASSVMYCHLHAAYRILADLRP